MRLSMLLCLVVCLSLSACNTQTPAATPPAPESQPEPRPEPDETAPDETAPERPKPEVPDPAPTLVGRDDTYAVGRGEVLAVNAQTGVLVNDSVAAGKILSATLETPPDYGSLTLNADGSFGYAHDGGEALSDSFSYKVSDGDTAMSALVTLTIDDRTPRPVVDVYQVVEDGSLVVSAAEGVLVNDRDPQGKTLVSSLLTPPVYGTLTLAEDGSFSYDHDGSEAPSDAFTYNVSNGAQSADVTVKVSVTPVNDAPYAAADEYEVSEGAQLTVETAVGLIANDVDVDSTELSVSVVTKPQHGALNLTADGAFTYQHDHSEASSDSFSYRLSDGELTSNATVTLSVLPVDDAPVIEKLELAQTHVMKPEGTTWAGAKLADRELHVVGNRDALVLVDINAANGRVVDAVVEAHVDGRKLGEVALNTPDALPPTEADGSAYSEAAYSANLDKAWVKPGLELIVRANEGQRSAPQAVNVGAPASFTMYTLPFYLFGLDESDIPFNQVAAPDQVTKDEYFAKHPFAQLEMLNHPAVKVEWDYIVVAPRQGRAAQKVEYKEQQGDGYAVMSATLNVLHAIRNANGDSPTNNQYYAPLLMANEKGSYSHPGGGLGGGNVGTGDHSYTGIFIHEAGHAFGMPHANDGYNSGTYPYKGGSLQGSTWGYDQVRGQFMPTFVPSTSPNFGRCNSWNIQFDDEGRCVKQDPMQGGSGYQAAGDKYTIFSDFNAAVVQGYLESKVIVDSTSRTGYSRWDTDKKAFAPFETTTSDNGIWGLNRNLPVRRDVPVNTLIVTLSQTTPEASQIYPPLSYRGNLLETIDPTDSAQLATIKPNVSKHAWYCHASGCDYTLRVTYADNSTEHIVLQGAFRKWAWAAGSSWGDFKDGMNDPASGDSFKTWSVNVSAEKSLKKIELLNTPQVYDGLPAEPEVLLTRLID